MNQIIDIFNYVIQLSPFLCVSGIEMKQHLASMVHSPKVGFLGYGWQVCFESVQSFAFSAFLAQAVATLAYPCAPGPSVNLCILLFSSSISNNKNFSHVIWAWLQHCQLIADRPNRSKVKQGPVWWPFSCLVQGWKKSHSVPKPHLSNVVIEPASRVWVVSCGLERCSIRRI